MKIRAFNVFCEFLIVSLNIISASLDARNETRLCEDCRESQVCCHNDCHWGSNCLGRDCKHDEHCSDGEMCCRDVCVIKNGTSRLGCYCEHSGQCAIGEICCDWECVSNDSSCDGLRLRNCLRDEHCSYDEICCGKNCVKGMTNKLGCHCENDESCSKGLFCCGFFCVSVSRRLGRLCVHDEDCSDGEICSTRRCIHRSETHLGCSCFNDEQCSKGQHCCSDKCVDAPNCLGLQCHGDWDCSVGEVCCDSVCVSGNDHIGCSCDNERQCSAGESCCGSTCVNATNCLGRRCKTDRDCLQSTLYHPGGGENCCEGVCSDSDLKESSLGCYCEYHDECFTGVESCCANTCINGSSCVGFSCNHRSPKCAHGETCCSNNLTCVNGTYCLEQNCQDHADCGFFENCCEGKCNEGVCIEKRPQSCESNKDCTKYDWYYCCNGQCSNDSFCFTPFMRALVTVFASFGVLLFLIVTYLCYRRKKRILRETLLLQAEDITTEQALDSQLFPLLPPYQPDDYAPPEYEQQQTDINTSYYPQTIEGHEPPPPYSAEFQGESGGEQTKI